MSLARFHPVVRRWFDDHFAAPTPAQARGWAAIRSGRDTVIAAPTGSGKTLAAFLTAIDDLLCEGVERAQPAAREAADEPERGGAASSGDAATIDAAAALPDEVRVVYVSPLKALSADIHRNLAEPRREIRALAEAAGVPPVRITAAVRTGDTTQAERAGMLRTPPHILVTTPESLYLLLTAERGRAMLSTARTVIVDEIHAVIESRRGAHLALTLERLDHVAGRRLQRIGLSATQRPIEDVGRFLVGGREPPAIVDEGHVRDLDLALEVTGSPLEAVMPAEAWDEVYDRLAGLIRAHRTTLVFVNTRRLAERAGLALAERLGDEVVASHHGSLSKERRLEAEDRLKRGDLRALVATASLELGIDIGHVDLVCQIGSPRRVATFLQRVGRSGHTVRGTPKGRLFPLSRDEAVECAALLRLVRRGELDRLVPQRRPLDVLAQQIVAETAAEAWDEDALFDLVRRATPYHDLERRAFDDVVDVLARGFATRRGRRAALVHRDAVNRRVRGRRGARIAALTSGGAIPDNADFRVVVEPQNTFVGTVNEDFAVESMPGDVFQLGNASWRILKVDPGVLRVADAEGELPSIPFWLGEAPARSDELSAAVSELRGDVDRLLGERAGEEARGRAGPAARVVAWLVEEAGIPAAAAEQIVEYLAETRRLLGVVPTQETLVLERFFDDSGGMQLVLHAPFGARVTRAWGLALRKKFCRTFNFELQAAATEEGLLLSLGPQHSFPLDDVFRYLRPATARDTLVQAVLDSPIFQTRWRWATTISLAVPRSRSGRRVPPPLQRMLADDLLAAAFPDAAACLENVAGDREVPDHPLVAQAVRDCLEEAMDLPRLERILDDVLAGRVSCIARDVPEPSAASAQIVNARVYEFLDDAPLEERRTQAVRTRRALEPSAAADLGALDAAAIARVRDEARPDPADADELHDALMSGGFLTEAEVDARADAGGDGPGDGPDMHALFDELARSGRAARVRAGAARVRPAAQVLHVATERLLEVLAVHPDAAVEPAAALDAARRIDAAARAAAGAVEADPREDAIRDLLRGRLECLGPTTAAELAVSLGVAQADAERALVALEARGVVLRGHFTPRGTAGSSATPPRGDGAGAASGASARAASGAPAGVEWCDRRLLARIHRYTLDRLRAEIRPVAPADLMRFLFRWQRVEPGHRAEGTEGAAAVVEQLEAYELPAGAWEADVLPARIDGYGPELLDALCLSGRVAWGRLSPRDGNGAAAGPLRSSPTALMLRERAAVWLRGRRADGAQPPDEIDSAPGDGAGASVAGGLSSPARLVLDCLATRGACFFGEITAASGLLPTQAEQALGELVAAGRVTADSFAGLRALLTPSQKRPALGAGAMAGGAVAPGGTGDGTRRRRRRRPDASRYGVDTAGRWSLLHAPRAADPEAAVEAWARTLLRRYGVVFRRLLARESGAPPWRELLRCYRRLEMRGEVRGGRFVEGFSGEQFALPEAVGMLRAVRREAPDGRLVGISAGDPLNLVGVTSPDERVPATATNRVVYRDGVPVAALEGGEGRPLTGYDVGAERAIRRALVRPPVAPALRGYLKRGRRARRREGTESAETRLVTEDLRV